MAERGRLDWTRYGEHVRTRSQRQPGATDIQTEWADEAFIDPWALTESPDHASKSGLTDRRTGYSPSAGLIITVIYMRDDLVGVNAWKAAHDYRKRYWKERND